MNPYCVGKRDLVKYIHSFKYIFNFSSFSLLSLTQLLSILMYSFFVAAFDFKQRLRKTMLV